MTALVFRQQSRGEADARRWIGRGQTLAFDHDGMAGELHLALCESATEQAHWHRFSSTVGTLAFSDFSPLFALLSECPAMTGDADDDGEWYWSLFNQSLFAGVAALLGDLRPTDAPVSEENALGLQVQVTFAGHRSRSQLRLSADTLNRLARQPGWVPRPSSSNTELPLVLPMVVATFALPLAQIEQLQTGDVLRAPETQFGVEGDGVIAVGRVALHGALHPHPDAGHCAVFSVYDIKELPMSYPNDPLVPDDEDSPYPHVDEQDAFDNTSAFDTPSSFDNTGYGADLHTESGLNAALNALPLELSIRCGQLRLTLGELQQLDVGSTVVVDNVTPGAAMLCHGSFPIAKGELVNVDGRLGLQLTSIINNQPLSVEKGV